MTQTYPILTTDAFILHTRAVGEADRIISFLTRESGVITIYARSIRREGAKMRSSVLPYSRVYISVILGRKNILKDISVADTLTELWSDQKKYTALVQLLHHIYLLVPAVGDRDVALFTIVETATQFLRHSDTAHADAILLTARVMALSVLGYVPDVAAHPDSFSDTLERILASSDVRRAFEQHLTTALLHQ